MPFAVAGKWSLDLNKLAADVSQKALVARAKSELASFLARQESPPDVELSVDGRPAKREEEVKPYGNIIYTFTRMRQVAQFALYQAQVQSAHIKSGRYNASWFLMYRDAEIAYSDVPQDADSITLTNDVPYARKIMTRGARIVGIPPGIVERVRQVVLRKYSSIVEANITYIYLTGGYELQTHTGQRKRPPRRSVKGEAVKYPALVLQRKF